MRIVWPTRVETGLLTAVIVLLVLLVSSWDFRVAKEQAIERKSACSCKPEIKGRQLYATMCQAPSTEGPWEAECLYR